MRLKLPSYGLAACATALLLAGCTNGLLLNSGLYKHTVEPLTFNREPTEVLKSAQEAKGRILQIEYPLSSAISVRLGTNGFGDVAKQRGITTIYYADQESWSALFGLWSMDVVHIYGR